MRDQPTKSYVYQPWGSLESNDWVEAGRMWAVGHPNSLVTITGLTKEEAQGVCKTLNDLGALEEAAP